MKFGGSIGIVYKDRDPEAWAMTSALIERLNLEKRGWVCSASDVNPDIPEARDTDLLITVGGDGTIIRATRLAVPYGIPILGVNMGRLGFMTELEAHEALDKVPQYLEGTGWIEERSMLQATILPDRVGDQQEGRPGPDGPTYHAINDVVVARGAVARVVKIGAYIDGTHLTDFRADAVIVATSTGSTGYNLAVGGPILPPEAEEIVLKAVAPHVGMAPALVLPSSIQVELYVETDHQAVLSMDGHVDMDLNPGAAIRVHKSPFRARFLRANPPSHFYASLTSRLGFGGGQSTTRAIQY